MAHALVKRMGDNRDILPPMLKARDRCRNMASRLETLSVLIANPRHMPEGLLEEVHESMEADMRAMTEFWEAYRAKNSTPEMASMPIAPGSVDTCLSNGNPT